jgi:hypothetical protein
MWDKAFDLGEVLERLRAIAATKEMHADPDIAPPLTDRASTIDELDAHERKLGRPIPEAIRCLYSSVGGVSDTPLPFPSVGGRLLPLEETEWVDQAEYPLQFENLEGKDRVWSRADYFLFGRFKCWDFITYCTRPPRGQPGTIVLLEDTCDSQIPSAEAPEELVIPFVILGDDLAAWLSRWMDYELTEWTAMTPEVPEELSPAHELAFREDAQRLNPGAKWTQERTALLRRELGIA